MNSNQLERFALLLWWRYIRTTLNARTSLSTVLRKWPDFWKFSGSNPVFSCSLGRTIHNFHQDETSFPKKSAAQQHGLEMKGSALLCWLWQCARDTQSSLQQYHVQCLTRFFMPDQINLPILDTFQHARCRYLPRLNCIEPVRYWPAVIVIFFTRLKRGRKPQDSGIDRLVYYSLLVNTSKTAFTKQRLDTCMPVQLNRLHVTYATCMWEACGMISQPQADFTPSGSREQDRNQVLFRHQ